MLMLGMCSLLPADTISILYETRPYTAGTALGSAAAYVSNWNTLVTTDPTPPAGYGSASVASFVNLNNSGTFGGSSQDIAFHTVINFTVAPSQAGSWSFQFGIDYGLGGVALLDGAVLDFKTTDMWWAGDFLNTSQILMGTSNLATGSHTIELFGLDACCDGQSAGRYQVGSAGYQTFTVSSSAIPEPSSVATMLSGLGFVAILARAHCKS
jgi:hypothetical protein